MRREVAPAAGGGVRLRLAAVERDRLEEIADLLLGILAGGIEHGAGLPDAFLDDVRRRLLPAAYTDALEEMEHGEPLSVALQAERADDVATLQRTLRDGRVRGRAWTTTLDEDEARAWLSALNGARVVLAQVVGIATEDDWERVADDADPATILLGYLGLLQEELVGALAEGLAMEEDA